MLNLFQHPTGHPDELKEHVRCRNRLGMTIKAPTTPNFYPFITNNINKQLYISTMKFKAPVLLVSGIIALLASCKKEDPAPPVLPETRLNVVNASVDVFNIFQSGNRINNTASLYPGGISGYLNVTAGEQNYEFKRNGSPDVVLGMKLALDTLTTHSLFVVGLAADQMFLSDDSFTADTGSRALVRFINASPDDGELNVALADTSAIAGETISYSDKAFKSISEFLPVAVTNGSKQLKISRSGGGITLLTDTINLQAGSVYTIFTKGKSGQAGSAAFGAGIITNQ
ncbi:MAG: DUF4397 domain-containing protein [Sphingobacteriaceae bacterium]|nr:MAG: DUF4397 domain-containing protein [Sphingobacteriaceae bacterium]